MEEEIKQHIEYFIADLKYTRIPLDKIKFLLIVKFNKKSLMYNFVANKWFEQYFALIRRLGYGTYDIRTQELILNENNDFITMMMVKYQVKGTS